MIKCKLNDNICVFENIMWFSIQCSSYIFYLKGFSHSHMNNSSIKFLMLFTAVIYFGVDSGRHWLFPRFSKNISKMFYVLQIQCMSFWGIFERRLTVWGRPYNVAPFLYTDTSDRYNYKHFNLRCKHETQCMNNFLFRNCNMCTAQSPKCFFITFLWNGDFLFFSKSFYMTATIGLLGILWLLLLLNLNCMNVFYLCKYLLLVCFTSFFINYIICWTKYYLWFRVKLYKSFCILDRIYLKRNI